DCLDNCPNDPNKTDPGACGCGTPESGDSDGDGIADCNDPCPNWPYDCSEDGQTITVAVGQSIQAAIDVVPNGGTVAIAAGTFPLTGPLDPGGRAMTIRGATDSDGNSTAILDGQGLTQVLIVQTGETSETVFENLVIRNGYSEDRGGGVHVVSATPVFRNCDFIQNIAVSGGGICNDLGVVTFDGCVFANNSALGDGGGVYNLGGDILATDSVFESNTAGLNAGGVVLVGGVSTFDACEFLVNSSTNGGAIYANDLSEVTIRDSVLRGNS
ncbi:MAG: hypothetical protein GY741_01635, partial [Phycisphaeraceae bacterium]|nr:hypothetical protein [Phycisphaeraceae bacterium]